MHSEFDRDTGDLGTRLKGEILASLSTWTVECGLTRLELAWSVSNMLLKHVGRTVTLDVYIEFIERLAAILGNEAKSLREVIHEDVRQRLN